MEVFIARQPIFDRRQRVFGYELLYRLNKDNFYVDSDGDKATSEVIANTFLLMGIESLTGGKRAFINFTENLLVNGVPGMLPAPLVAVEILEDVRQNKEVIAACTELKQQGYTIVLDDYVFHAKSEPLLELADIIKIDFLSTKTKDRADIIKQVGNNKIRFLAEKVETQEALEEAMNLGYTYFQGHFFSKPVILWSQDVPIYKVNYLQVLHELNNDMDFGRLESVIKRDVSLTYKLMKYINSASFGFRTKINSIRHALVMLGVKEIRKWISLIALRSMAEDKPDEILTCSVVRGRFGELMAPRVGLADKGSDLFLMGIFSMLDALLGRPMDFVLEGLPISHQIKEALLGKDCKYREVLDLIVAYEKADWANFSRGAAKFGLSENDAPEMYIKSLEWADKFGSV